jgi:hypothetical protein
MTDLAYLRCFNHAGREAVARCPECRQFFCRECVTEHDDRVICAACLRNLVKTPSTRRRAFSGLARFIQFAFGILLAWFFFFLLGETLARLPDAFHESTLWHVPWIERR